MLPLVFVLIMSVFLVMDPNSFNRFFDFFVPAYSVLAVLLVVYWVKRSRKEAEAEPSDRTYVFKKKNKLENLSWKQRFAGTWAKIERKGIYEFFLFSGVPGIVAWAQKDSDYGQIILNKPDDENVLSITATGFPPVQGSFAKVGNSEETAEPFPGKDPAGRPVTGRFWWDEPNQSVKARVDNPGTKITGYLTRKILDGDILHLECTNVKEDSSKCSFECTFKRVG